MSERENVVYWFVWKAGVSWHCVVLLVECITNLLESSMKRGSRCSDTDNLHFQSPVKPPNT